MPIEIRIEGPTRTFPIKLVGVTHANADGTPRQDLVRRLTKGEELVLTPEPNNPHDAEAVAVFNRDGQQLGYLPRHSGVALLIDRGAHVTATVLRVVGGGGLLALLFRSRARNYGCIIAITEGDYDWRRITPLMNADRAISQLFESARQLERKDQQAAVSAYRDVIERIRAFDAEGPLARAWRTVRYPINRLTLVLERLGATPDALQEIARYESYADRRGIPTADSDALSKRKERLLRRVPKKGA
jgi:hypothetical protein